MNRTEHLLSKVAEECAEIAQRALKAQQFGLDEVQAGQDLDNRVRLLRELNDLYGVLEMLDLWTVDRSQIEAKKLKVERFLNHARTCGTLTDGLPGDKQP